jgi:hypothetical protein
MNVRRLSLLQWIGFLVGGPVWFAEYIAGIGVTQAVCNPASGQWGIPNDAVQLGLMSFAGACTIVALAASVVVFRATHGEVEEQDPPPPGRIHFFAVASIGGNVIFLIVILLTGIGTIVDRTCHQA